MTEKTGARPPEPAKTTPVKKAAPKQRPAEPPAAPALPEPSTVHRAGGWIDRGDGRGWELEE